jgi:hypothetical protein
MAISQEQLAAIIGGRARQLCSPENDKLIESYKRSNNNLNDPDPSYYDSDAAEYDNMYLSESVDYNDGLQYSNTSASNSKMPEYIKQSMLEKRIDTTALGQTSVLDTLGVKPVKRTQQRRQPMNEQTRSAQVSSIDYSLIKTIVNECLNEYFAKQPLNESATLKTIGLSGGNISLVDNKGNIYKAKLEKIGNKNDNK